MYLNLNRKLKILFALFIIISFTVGYLLGTANLFYNLFLKQKGIIISNDLEFIYNTLSGFFENLQGDEVNGECFYQIIFESYAFPSINWLDYEGYRHNLISEVKKGNYSFLKKYPDNVMELGIMYSKGGFYYCDLERLLEVILGRRRFLAWENWKNGRYYGGAEMIYDTDRKRALVFIYGPTLSSLFPPFTDGFMTYTLYVDEEKLIIVSGGIVDEIARLQKTPYVARLFISYLYPSYDELQSSLSDFIIFGNSTSITIYSWKRHWIDLFKYHFQEFLSNTTVLNKLHYFYMLNNVSFVYRNITVKKNRGVEISIPHALFKDNATVKKLITKSHMGFLEYFWDRIRVFLRGYCSVELVDYMTYGRFMIYKIVVPECFAASAVDFGLARFIDVEYSIKGEQSIPNGCPIVGNISASAKEQ